MDFNDKFVDEDTLDEFEEMFEDGSKLQTFLMGECNESTQYMDERRRYAYEFI